MVADFIRKRSLSSEDHNLTKSVLSKLPLKFKIKRKGNYMFCNVDLYSPTRVQTSNFAFIHTTKPRGILKKKTSKLY